MPRVRRKDSVWTETWKNGIVLSINYDAEEVYVYFYNYPGDIQAIDLDQFNSWSFDDNLNQWQLPEV